MKICDCVKDSIWYDPRVMKQVEEYLRNGIELVCVGVKDFRFQAEEVAKIPCNVMLANVDTKLYSEKRTFFDKIYREVMTNIELYRLMRKTKADIIHANDLNALVPAYFAARKIGAKLIYDTHEIFVENPWMDRHKVVKFIWSVIERFLIKKVDLIVCVSHAAATYLSKRYGIPLPMVVTNCISESTVNGLILHEKRNVFEVLNHGQFYGGRGYDVMIRAAEYLKGYPDIELVLRGFGSMENELRELKQQMNADNVRFDPPVKVYEMIPYAAASSVGLAITESISLNFELSVSNKLFEYAAAGLPVIMSDIPEHRYLNEKYDFGIVLKDNQPETLAKAIVTLFEDRDMYQRYASNVRRLSQEITWEKQFGVLLAYENEVVARPREAKPQ